MNLLPLILARSHDDLRGKIVIALVVLLVWGHVALARLMKKQKRDRVKFDPFAPPAASRQIPPLPQPGTARPGRIPRLPPSIPRRMANRVVGGLPPLPRRTSTARAPIMGAKLQPPKRVRRVAAGAAAIPLRPVSIEAVAERRIPVKPLAANARAVSVSSVDARGMSAWLRPHTLRAQFILTEIFQPPLALREAEEDESQ